MEFRKAATDSWRPLPGASKENLQTQSTWQSDSNCYDSYINNVGDYPTSESLPFPYPTGPYPQQAALMDTLLEGIPRRPSAFLDHRNKTRILALESPTGTGKSLSLACAGLAWLDHEEALYYSDCRGDRPETTEATPSKGAESMEASLKPSPTSVAATSTGIDWLDSWKPPQENDEKKAAMDASNQKLERHSNLVEALDKLRLQLRPAVASSQVDSQQNEARHRERRENLLRVAVTKARMEERKRARKRKRSRTSLSAAPRLEYEEENEQSGKAYRKPTPGTAEWLLWNPRNDEEKGRATTASARPPQIVYAARTHSQLSQFVSEIRKTRWGKTLRVVALASRGQGLCGELTHARGRTASSSPSSCSEEKLTETCLDLRKASGGCSHYPSEETVSALALHGLVEATDLEDLVALGRATKTCAYYAARRGVPHAQLVVLPYASLCSAASREALGLELHSNTLVLVDEAHNLPESIANLTSAKLARTIAIGASEQLRRYLQKYVDRLSPHHLRLLGDLKRLIRGLIASMEPNSESTRHNEPQHQQDSEQQRYLLSSSQFLVSQKLETINLFPVLRYMKESKLSQKLLGFKTKPGEPAQGEESSPSNEIEVSGIPSHISPMSVVETFLEKLTYASDDDGQVVIDLGDGFREGNGGQNLSMGGRNGAYLRFCVLNPAVQARDALWTAPRAVALVGGTLQPLDVMMRELIPGTVAEHAAKAQSSWIQPHRATSFTTASRIPNPYRRKETSNTAIAAIASGTATMGGHRASSKQTKIYRSDDFWAFTCGHVVDPSQVLLQSLTRVGGLSIDVRHKTRSTPSMTKAIGSALVKLCKSVQHGMVVFLPSYKYEAVLVDAWKKTSTDGSGKNIWDQLQQATTVVREPKEASRVEATLALYSRAASKSPRGALLLSVVGGKLSEGINFANDLCRCVVVVGLPFADRSDPLLQEKLKLVALGGATATCTNGTASSSKAAASDYYRSLCLRAVNQSVGRAIRHAKDWATIVLMDARYPSDEAIARGLPSWLTESTPSWRKESGDLEDVLGRTRGFFDGRA